ncbi:unnamed protein product [Zymoseptoria tritici ST99CH_1A5]|uniref:Knr4/Smi1-like domain-containing protein n=2 Tax=Zymoseptoria tritici TaxID=1047171 RepID=F9XAD3_ZYMTI|nr:uncharacterized protein MYCGRDRAFT_92804 [Zymoseptoria tritici IPO323]EGP88247.1 hypothetical protein MYCGRDRAFT_92804 [Zymoseptoria tritici IPO323]SMR52268.1 unnamed protein product [Zymoseptoria tritici ST99CH_3D1]SMY23921.1 unnamed protein product [Zymoseptoria tritici ST99CH_1A5]
MEASTPPSSIAQALDAYKVAVAAKNQAVLEVIVETLTSLPLPSNMTAEYAKAKRFDWLKHRLGTGITAFASSPEDLLSATARAELVSRLELDGVSHQLVDQEAREKWFAATKDGISKTGVEVERAFPPPEIEKLCCLVSSVHGPGLPYWRDMKGFDLLAPARRQVQMELTQQRAIVPAHDDDADAEPTEVDYLWEEWDITVAVKIGDGCSISNGGSFAMYCRKAEAEEWKWRYAVHDGEWSSDVYETLEEYLGFYAHFGEQSEDKAEWLAEFAGM